MSATTLETSYPFAGDVFPIPLPCAADTYYIGMPLAYTVTPTCVVAGTGNGTVSAISAGKDVLAGTWVFTFTGATAGRMVDASGNDLGDIDLVTTVSNNSGGLIFTWTVGLTPHIAGDTLTFTVGTAGTYAYNVSFPEVICWETPAAAHTSGNILCAVSGSAIASSGIKDDSNAALTLNAYQKAYLEKNGIIIK